MISEAALAAAGLGARFLTAATTCPAVAAGLRRNRFREGEASPIHFFSADREGLGEPIVFGAHWGDNTLVPYPTRWWDDPPEGPKPA
jgi:hypothetical protein